MSRILLLAINPTITYFKVNKKNKLVSEIFTIEDEAFDLVMIHNEVERWIADHLEDNSATSTWAWEKDDSGSF